MYVRRNYITSNAHNFEPTDNTVIVRDVDNISKVGIYLNAGHSNKKKLLISKQLSSAYSHSNNIQ